MKLRSLIATAGHCVSDGSGHFYKNFIFTPAYRYDRVTKKAEAPFGRWSVETFTTTSTFLKGGGRPLPNLHDDFAVLRMRPGPDGKNIQYYTGSLGWVFNTSQHPIPVVTYDMLLSGYSGNVDSGYTQQVCHGGPTDTEDFGSAASDALESAFYQVGCHLKQGSSGAPYFTLHDCMAISVMSFGLPSEGDKAYLPWLGPYSLQIYDALAQGKKASSMADHTNDESGIVLAKPQGGLPKDIDYERLATNVPGDRWELPLPGPGQPRTSKDAMSFPVPPNAADLVKRSGMPPVDPAHQSQKPQ